MSWVGTNIDYGGMQKENYEIFPEGSLFASYGTIADIYIKIF